MPVAVEAKQDRGDRRLIALEDLGELLGRRRPSGELLEDNQGRAAVIAHRAILTPLGRVVNSILGLIQQVVGTQGVTIARKTAFCTFLREGARGTSQEGSLESIRI